MIVKVGTPELNLSYNIRDFSLFQEEEALEPRIRKLREMEEVFFSRDFMSSADKETALNYMYRDIARSEERGVIEEMGLRYDLTIMPPLLLERDYKKTIGHYHLIAEGNLTYPQIYEVLDRKAHHLLQKPWGDDVLDVALVEAGREDKVLIPPNYGHIIINPSPSELEMANWVSSRFTSAYRPILDRRGGAYFEMLDHKSIKNGRYPKLPPLRRITASEVEWYPRTRDVYTIFLQRPGLLVFLNNSSECHHLEMIARGGRRVLRRGEGGYWRGSARPWFTLHDLHEYWHQLRAALQGP